LANRINKLVLRQRVIGGVVVYALSMSERWTLLHERISDVMQLQEKYASQVDRESLGQKNWPSLSIDFSTSW
jgi:hypothetical protein